MRQFFRHNSLLLDNVQGRDRYFASFKQRINAFQTVQSAPNRRVIDGALEDKPTTSYEVPGVEASELTLDFLSKCIREHGCCHVRGFFTDKDVKELQGYVDYGFSAHQSDNLISRYLDKPLDLEEVLKHTRADIEKKSADNPTYTNILKLGNKLRRTLAADSSCLTATSPMVSEKLLSFYERKGLKRILDGYFENGPCVSIYKWVLRKAVSPKANIDFHQDGAFMGDDIDSLNCWIPLTDCGTGTSVPGMDIVPVRLMKAFAKGTGMLDWTIAESSVIDSYGPESIVTPAFRKGDAFFFDHCLLHRTQHSPDASSQRYAIETWFFDSVNFPKNQIPLRW